MIVNRSVDFKEPASIVVLSLLVAFFADIKPVNWSFAYGGSIDAENAGLMGVLYPLALLSIIVFSIGFKNVKWHLSKQIVFLILYLILFNFFSTFFVGPPRTSVAYFLGFVLGAMVIPNITRVDTRIYLRALMFYPSFAIFRLEQVFTPIRDWQNLISMDSAYAFLIPIVATIVYMFQYYRYDKKWTKLYMSVLCLINGVFCWELFLHGSRGPLLSIVLLVFFLLIVRKNQNAPGVSLSKGKFRFFFLLLLVFLSGYIFFFQLFIDLLANYGIESYSLSKILDLNSEGDLSNGRSALNVLTFKGIIEHPLFGNGFDRYDANTHALYPHNFILQLLYDGGLLYFLVVLTPVVMGIIKKMKNCNHDEYAMMACLFFCSVPGAMFSISLYENGALWLFFGYAISNSMFVYSNQIKRWKENHLYQ